MVHSNAKYLHTPNDAIKMSCTTVNNVYTFIFFFNFCSSYLNFHVQQLLHTAMKYKTKATQENLFPYKNNSSCWLHFKF